MNMFDEAKAIVGMINMCHATQNEIAEKMGVSQSYIANKIRLLKIPPVCQTLILNSGLSEGHARALLRLKDEADIICAIEKIDKMRLNVSLTEALVDSMIIEDKPKMISECTTHQRIATFDIVLNDALKYLKSVGIKVFKSSQKCGNKNYISLCIEE